MGLRAAFAAVLAAGFACGGSQAEPEASPVAAPSEPVTVVVALRFVEGPDDEETATPTTRVLLVDIDQARGRRTTDLGTYRGVCSHLAAGEGLLLAAQCFWVGEGVRLAVREGQDALVATRTVLDAERNDVEASEIARVDLPPSAELEVMAPATRLGSRPPRAE